MSRILIIEDEASIRRVLVKILTEENEQYQVFEAEDGLIGTEMIKNEDFDLVLCDIKMPKMDGVEVLEAVKKIKPEIPMVMISGHGDLDTAVNTMRMGAFDYISKPPDLNRLLNTIRNALDRKQLVVENKRLKRKVSKQYQMVGNSKHCKKILGHSFKNARKSFSSHAMKLKISADVRQILLGHKNLTMLQYYDDLGVLEEEVNEAHIGVLKAFEVEALVDLIEAKFNQIDRRICTMLPPYEKYVSMLLNKSFKE